MIRLRGVRFTYPDADAPALDGVDLDVDDGDFMLVAGATGSGKSTLLRIPAALVPHHSGGRLEGTVTVAGRDVAGLAGRDLAGTVGFVPQDPEAHATSDRVVPELAFTMENLATPPTTMRKRIEEVIDQLGIAHLRDRRLDQLSSGERQRVAIAAVLTALPKVLICDEPTSALDPQSAEDVFSVLGRLRDELGLTIVCSEHRLERVVSFADKACWLGPHGADAGDLRDVFARAPFAPPVTVLGKRLGWEPLPLTVREGRRFAASLDVAPPVVEPRAAGDVVLEADGVAAAIGRTAALRSASVRVHRGEVTALVGRNGAGKTTLLRVLAGLHPADAGEVRLAGRSVGKRRSRADIGRMAFVPQRAEMLLYKERVRDEVPDASWRQRLGLEALADRHPWTLSAGQRLWTALGTAFSRPDEETDVLLLDEPTRGLDPPGKDRLSEILREKADAGLGVLLVTHDVELVARACDRVHLLAEGAVVASGSVRDVLGESLLFSSQISKVMDDPRFLTPDDVTSGLRA